MNQRILFVFILIALNKFTLCKAQVFLNADSTPNNTYELINSVLAPGNDAVEVPDCSHGSFGRHITEVFDNELNKNVFEFNAHINEDNDRCINFDRQRVEIKTYAASPDNLKGISGETLVYKWKFKLPQGFQPSTSFTHIHQIKAVDGDESLPLFTLTPRKGSTNKMTLLYIKDNVSSVIELASVDLSDFENVWVEATETIKIGTNGTYSITLNRASDNVNLLSYSSLSIQTIRPDNSFIRPKWGIYRSLNNSSDLRDESVRFSDFSIYEQPRKIILKLDDFNTLNLTDGGKAVLDYLSSLKIKAGLGFIAGRNDETALAVFSSYLNEENGAGERLFEVWHHGLDHINPEFEINDYIYQKAHFDGADALIKEGMRIQMHTFGAPYNHTDTTTNTIIAENPNYSVTLFNNPAPDLSLGILNLTNRVNMESATGVPSFSFFQSNYNNFKSSYTDYMVLQGHPNQWDTARLDEFKSIINFLLSEGCEFVLPYEYYLSVNNTLAQPMLPQTITFPSISVKEISSPDFNPGATSDSNLPVSYNSSNSSVATIVNGNIHIVGSGTVTITASQMGDSTYKAAKYVSQTLTVASIDYRTKQSGNWNDLSSWQVRAIDGTWTDASEVPNDSNNVYIQNGHTITIDSNEAYCNDFNINATTASTGQGFLVISGSYNLNIKGKIRAYSGTAITSASDDNYIGTSTDVLLSGIITTNSTGVLKFIGGSRDITSIGEWKGTATTNNVVFALDEGAIGVLNTSIKFKTITFQSGIIYAKNTINVGSSSTTFNGVLTINNGAKLISSRNYISAGSQAITYSSTVKCGTVNIDSGGVLELTANTPVIDCVTFNNNGTVIYSGGVQTFLQTGAGSGNPISSYNNVTITGIGDKSLPLLDVYVNGNLYFEYNKVITGDNRLIIGSQGTVNSSSDTGWVVGNLEKQTNALNNPGFSYGIGDANFYTPIELIFNANTLSNGSIMASTSSGDHSEILNSGINSEKSVNRVWKLVNNGINGFSNYDINFTFALEDNDLISNSSDYVVKNYDGGIWKSLTSSSTPNTTHAFASNMTSFGDFIIGELSTALNVVSESLTTFKYYPNPVQSILKLNCTNPIIQIEIFNISGQSVFKYVPVFNQSQVELNLINLMNGIYVAKIKTETEIAIIKLIKT